MTGGIYRLKRIIISIHPFKKCYYYYCILTTYNLKLHLKNLFSCFFSLICVSFLLFFFHLYYIIFLTFGEKKTFPLVSSLHFSLCLNFSSKILLYISSFFLSFKKLVSTLYYTQYVIVLYTIILLSARRLNFLFLFFHRKKIRTYRPSLLT